jgi:SH3 domain-containing protein
MFRIYFLGLQVRLREQRLFRLVVVLLSVNIVIGCAHQNPTLVAEAVVEPTFHNGHEILLLQNEIERLQELIKEKDALIRQQNAHQQSQEKEQQVASSEVTRVQTRLHRLATKPSTASTIAEVEVAMESLKQEQAMISDQALQQQAQSLLDAALASYKQGEYVIAMNYASQAHEFINMAADQNRKASYYNRKTVPIYVSLMLKTLTDVNLRENPHSNAKILNILEKGSVLVANAYRGNWFRVQTDDGLQGWVSNTLVRTVEDKPKEIVQE